MDWYIIIVPGRAGGEWLGGKRTHKAKKEFACGMLNTVYILAPSIIENHDVL